MRAKPLWFVFDLDNDFRTFDTEEEARRKFEEVIKIYRDDAAGAEWDSDADRICWGQIIQTTQFRVVAPDPWDDPDTDRDFDEIWELDTVDRIGGAE